MILLPQRKTDWVDEHFELKGLIREQLEEVKRLIPRETKPEEEVPVEKALNSQRIWLR